MACNSRPTQSKYITLSSMVKGATKFILRFASPNQKLQISLTNGIKLSDTQAASSFYFAADTTGLCSRTLKEIMDSKSLAEGDHHSMPFSSLHGDERFCARLFSRDSGPVICLLEIITGHAARFLSTGKHGRVRPRGQPAEGQATPPLRPPPMLHGAQLARRSCHA